MKMTGYYNEQLATDQRLAVAMLEIQRRLNAGEKWAKGRNGVGITIRKVLTDHGVGTKFSGFVTGFDFSKKITEGRISRERHAWQMQEVIRWALAHPQEAERTYGKKKDVAPKEKPVKKEAEEAKPREVRLLDFDFKDGMETLRLRWQVRTPKGFESAFTKHELTPNIYSYKTVRLPSGQLYVKKTRLGGAFREGKLTAEEFQRIVSEGREQIAAALPGKVLESEKDTQATLRYLFR